MPKRATGTPLRSLPFAGEPRRSPAGAGLLAFTSVVANERLSAAKTALVAGRDGRAAADARSAQRFAPWSVDALQLQAVARAHQGRHTGALALYTDDGRARSQ